MSSHTNINVGRVLAGATTPVLDLSKPTVDLLSSGTPPTFQKGVVEEIVWNPKALNSLEKDRLRALVVNPESVENIAANSVVAMIVSDGVSDATATRVLLSPFFQSHFMLPVQIGEQITVVFEDFHKYGYRSGKWITRSPEGFMVEDANFTHGDRRFFVETINGVLRTSSSLARQSTQPGSFSPGFPNGGGTAETATLPQAGSTNPFDLLYQKSISGSMKHTYEVVPRWTKHPQEFVIQGMNNALIVLGQDRPGGLLEPAEVRPYAGCIDMVAGRGRYLLEPATATSTTSSPLTAFNSRSLLETDKTPKLNGKPGENLNEGEPDLARDAVRLHLSMRTEGDKNFRLQRTTSGAANNAMQPAGLNFSTNSLFPIQFPSSSNGTGNSYLVGKADHVRLIARRSLPSDNAVEPISGSVLILKEGKNRTPDSANAGAPPNDSLAYLYMSPEGRVQVDGLQIFLGGASLNPLNNGNQQPPPDRPRNPEGSTAELTIGEENRFAGLEPYIKWTEFKKVVEGLQRQVDALQTAYSALVEDMKTAGQLSVCSPGGPDTAWATLNPNITLRRNNLRAAINQHRVSTNQAVYRSRSSKIFGQ